MGRKVLFVGNGINRLEGNDGSWEFVLNSLASSLNEKIALNFLKEKPFTLVFDEIFLNTKRRSSEREIELKKHVAELVEKIPRNKYHDGFVNSPVKHIITPNYDYNFENASKFPHKEANLKKETKYSLFRRRKVGSTSVWHMHGEARVPNSVMLGHDQYSGYMQKLRAYLTTRADRATKATSPYKRNIADFENNSDHYSWVDIFLENDVHIVGYSLDYTEIEMWWLLYYKEKLKQLGKFKTGETHFYYFQVDNIDDREMAKHSLLKSFGVKVHSPKYSSYSEAYDDFLDRL